ncbi:MAG: hypothetical protein LBJ67_06010 [Planctomycetaceae bacterium]|nr:hypothetical protein [Planctomycetaceae bacterium]
MTDEKLDDYIFEVNFGGKHIDKIENMAQPEADCSADCSCSCPCICIATCTCNGICYAYDYPITAADKQQWTFNTVSIPKKNAASNTSSAPVFAPVNSAAYRVTFVKKNLG